MGIKNKAYTEDLPQQAYVNLVSMQAFEESKRAAVADKTYSARLSPCYLP